MAIKKTSTSDVVDRPVSTWVIKKEISLGDIIAFTMAFFSVIYAYFTLDKRLAVLEDRAIQQEVSEKRKETEAQRAMEEIRQGLRDINNEIKRWYTYAPRASNIPQP